MKIKFTVSEDEMLPYKEALKNDYIVTLPGVTGKHVMNSLDIEPVGVNDYELTVDYGKVVKRGKRKDEDKLDG